MYSLHRQHSEEDFIHQPIKPFPNSDDWTAWGITADLHRFFVLLWDEVLSQSTVDSWQTRTSTIATLIDELLEVAAHSEVYPPAKYSLPHLIREIRHKITVDPVIRTKFPIVVELIDVPPTPFEQENHTKALHDLVQRASIARSCLRTYGQTLASETRKCLAAADGRKKEEIHNLTSALASALAAEGYSLAWMRRAASTLLDPSEPDFVNRYDKMIAMMNGDRKPFTCIVGVIVDRGSRGALKQLLGDRLRFGVPPGPLTLAEQDFYGRAEKELPFIQLEIEALDEIVARREAEDKTSALFGTLNLLRPTAKFDIWSSNLLVKSSNATWNAIPLRRFRSLGLRDAVDPESLAKSYSGVAPGLAQKDRDQLTSALQHHRLALSAMTDESRLLNMWIALETLCMRTDGSIIDAVCSQASASIAGRKIPKLLSAVAAAIAGNCREKEIEDVSDALPNSTPSRITLRDLFDALLDKKEGEKIEAHYKHISGSMLLCYRVHQCRQILSRRDSVVDQLLQHRRNIDWQIRRIYRARNQIAHTGRGPRDLTRLIQHLHSYLGATLHNLLFDLCKHPTWTIPTALSHRVRGYDRYLARLQSQQEQMYRYEGLTVGSLYVRTIDDAVWFPAIADSLAPVTGSVPKLTASSPPTQPPTLTD